MIPFSKNFNLLIGPNNSGKTNIVDAIDFLFNPGKKPDRLHDTDAELELKLQFGDTEQHKFTCDPIVRLKGNSVSVQCIDAKSGDMGSAVQMYVSSRIKTLFYSDFTDFPQIKSDYAKLAKQLLCTAANVIVMYFYSKHFSIRINNKGATLRLSCVLDVYTEKSRHASRRVSYHRKNNFSDCG